MAPSDAEPARSEFYCVSLSQCDERCEKEIYEFEPVAQSGYGLVCYLKEHAAVDEKTGVMRTYLVRDRENDELVGYFSLKAGLVSLDEKPDGKNVEFDTVPGVELANFAINNRYRERHGTSKGCGKIIFRELVLPIVREASRLIGVCLLYIYSLPIEALMLNYATYGFCRLPEEDERLLHARLKPRYDKQCVFMYMML